MKKLLIFISVLLIGTLCWANPKISVPFIDSPIIDGTVNENEWAKSTAMSAFMTFGQNKKADYNTKVYFGYNDNKLFIAYKLYLPYKPKMSATKNGDSYWEDDDIEIIVSPYGDDRMFQIVTNATGGRVVFYKNNIENNMVKVETKSRLYDYTTKENSGYEGEILIEFPNELKNLKLTVLRYVPASNVNYVLCDAKNNFTGGSVFNPEFFADLTFGNYPGLQDVDFSGTKWNINNPDNLPLNYELITDKEIYKGLLDTRDYNELLDLGLYTYTFRIKSNDEILIENSAVSDKVDFINYKIEKNNLIADFNFSGFEIGLPVTFEIVKEDKLCFGFNKTTDNDKDRFVYDLSKAGKGTYKLNFSIGKVYSFKDIFDF